MIRYRDLFLALESLQIPKHAPVLVISDENLGGKVQGGEQTALTALMAVFDTMMMPAFTSSTMIVPQNGPDNNALDYASQDAHNWQADFYSADLPPDEDMGKLVRLLMKTSETRRSIHPLLSFVGLGVDAALQTQTDSSPWAPIIELEKLEGWVILFGASQESNVCLHVAESMAGRRLFTRWALTNEGIVECHGMPGCTKGFSAIAGAISDLSRKVLMPSLDLIAYPIGALLKRTADMIKTNSKAMLCADQGCPFCAINRNSTITQA